MVDGVPVYGFHSDMFEKYARIGNIDEGIIDAVRNVADACAAVEAADEYDLDLTTIKASRLRAHRYFISEFGFQMRISGLDSGMCRGRRPQAVQNVYGNPK